MNWIFNITALELQLKKISFFWWCFSWSSLAVFFISVFETVAGEQGLSQDFIKSIPPELAKSVNIGNNYLEQIESFISGQFLTFYLLIGGIYLTMVGINSISGKIQNGQILEYIFRPYTRSQVFIGVYLSNLIFIVVSNFIVTISLFLSAEYLTDQSDISLNYFIFFYLGNILLQFFFLNLGLLFGLLVASGKQVGIGIGMVVASWFINNILNLTDLPKALRFISPFYYFDTSLLSSDFALDNFLSILILFMAIALSVASYYKWRFRDIQV